MKVWIVFEYNYQSNPLIAHIASSKEKAEEWARVNLPVGYIDEYEVD